jgi:hypothetical protein
MSLQMPNSPPLTISSRGTSTPNHDRYAQLQKESNQIPLPPSPQSIGQSSPRTPSRKPVASTSSRSPESLCIIPPRKQPALTASLQPTHTDGLFAPGFPQFLPLDIIDRRKTPDRRYAAPNVSWASVRRMDSFDDASTMASRSFSLVSSIEMMPVSRSGLSSSNSRTSRLSPVPRSSSRLSSPIEIRPQTPRLHPVEPESKAQRAISPAPFDAIPSASPPPGSDDWSRVAPLSSLYEVGDDTSTPESTHHNADLSPRSSRHENRESVLCDDDIQFDNSLLHAPYQEGEAQTGIARIACKQSARTISVTHISREAVPSDIGMPPIRFLPSSDSTARQSRFTEHLDLSGPRMYASQVDLVGSRSSLVGMGYADGSERSGDRDEGLSRNDSKLGKRSSEGSGSKHVVVVEAKEKKGWKGALRKGAMRMFCCVKENPEEDL